MHMCSLALWQLYYIVTIDGIYGNVSWKHTCYIWLTCFSTDSMYSYEYKLCSHSRWIFPSFVWGIHHIGASKNDWDNIYYTMLMLPKYSFTLNSLIFCFNLVVMAPPRSTNEQSPQIIEHKLHAKSKNKRSTSEEWFFKYYIYDRYFVFERTWCRLFLTCVVYT
jgi:hypothetical protein